MPFCCGQPGGGRAAARRGGMKARAVQVAADRPSAGEGIALRLEFEAKQLASPAGVIGSRLAEALHEIGGGGSGLTLTTAAVVRSDAGDAALREAVITATDGAR